MVVANSDKLGYHQKWVNAGWNWVAYQEMAENINIDENDNFSDFKRQPTTSKNLLSPDIKWCNFCVVLYLQYDYFSWFSKLCCRFLRFMLF